MSAWCGETSAELHAEASLPRAAVPAQNVDRESLLASRPRLQAGECLRAVKERNRGRLSAQKSDDTHAFWREVLLRLRGFQCQPLVSNLDCERKANRWKLLLACGDALGSLSPFPSLPRPLAKPDRQREDQCRDDERDEGLLLPQVVQRAERVEPRLT